MPFYLYNFKKRIFILFLILINFIAFNNKGLCNESDMSEVRIRQESVTVIKNDRVKTEKYQITAGDVLSISIYDEPNLTQPEIVVRPDGNATIVPIGEVFVEGLDIQQLTKVLEEKFKEYFIEPRISVNIRDFNPASVYIFGAVEKPGTYQQMTTLSKQFADSKNPIVRTDLTLINVISNAGGVSADADLSKITVTDSNKKVKEIDLWKFIKDGDVSQNIKLKTGDVIFVPKVDSITINDEDFKLLTKMSLSPASFPVRVVGEVKAGGTFNVKGESPYLNTAISNASGYTLDANKTIVVIHRKASDDKLVKLYVNPFKQDFVLRPNDLVEVRKRNFMKFVYGMDYLYRIAAPFNTIPSAGNSWADWFKPTRRYYRY